jgi:hypothetical protein
MFNDKCLRFVIEQAWWRRRFCCHCHAESLRGLCLRSHLAKSNYGLNTSLVRNLDHIAFTSDSCAQNRLVLAFRASIVIPIDLNFLINLLISLGRSKYLLLYLLLDRLRSFRLLLYLLLDRLRSFRLILHVFYLSVFLAAVARGFVPRRIFLLRLLTGCVLLDLLLLSFSSLTLCNPIFFLLLVQDLGTSSTRYEIFVIALLLRREIRFLLLLFRGCLPKLLFVEVYLCRLNHWTVFFVHFLRIIIRLIFYSHRLVLH